MIRAEARARRREQVLFLRQAGLTREVIAASLGVSPTTVTRDLHSAEAELAGQVAAFAAGRPPLRRPSARVSPRARADAGASRLARRLEMRRLRSAGASMAEIAAACGVSKSTVFNELHGRYRPGGPDPPRRKPLTADERAARLEQIVAMAAAGSTTAQIAAALGVSSSTVRRELKRSQVGKDSR